MNLSLKLIIRNLIRDKSYPVLNIIGLTIAFACVFAVIVWVKYELSYDKRFPHSDRIYRLTFETSISGNTLHFARCNEKWISEIPASFPQIEELVRLEPYRHTAVKINENKFYSDRVFATDSNFFSVFGIELVSGDLKEVLKQPYSAVISSSIASKCFGSKDPVGQTFLMSGEYDDKKTPFTVTGVMKDSPLNSHIHFDIVTSFVKPQEAPEWAYIYLLLKKRTYASDILKGLPAFMNELMKIDARKYYRPDLQKITDIHLYSDKDREIEQNGNITRVYLFIAISLVMFLVSLTNYYNLSKARIFSMQKQIRILQVICSGKWIIERQSLIESAVCVVISLALAVCILCLPARIITLISGINLPSSLISDLITIWPVILLIMILSILTGSMPVIIHVYRSKRSLSKGRGMSSYGILMIFQFSLAIVLLVASIIINHQKSIIMSKSIGKMSSDFLAFKRQNWEVRGKYQTFKERALQNPLIKSVSASMEEPGGETLDMMTVESPELDESHKDTPLYVLSVDDNFLNFFDLPLVAGSSFSLYNPSRKGEDYILNETAVKKLGWTPQEAIGRSFKIKFDYSDIFYGGTVVGVVRDFNFTTLKQEVKPYVLFQKPIFYLCFLVRIDSARKEEAIAWLKKIWDDQLPDYPFQYEFVSDLYKTVYQKELSQSKLTSVFSFLAILIICLGLFSVTSILVVRRTKEIGIRKANGAKIEDVLVLLNSGFIKWVLISFIIACPVAIFGMNKWLQGFAYKTKLSWWVFVLSGVIVLLITLITVSFQTWKAATNDPVKALRYE